MCSPYPVFVLTNIVCIEKALKETEIVFVLTNIVCIEKALKETEIVFVLTVFLLTRFYCSKPIYSLCTL